MSDRDLVPLLRPGDLLLSLGVGKTSLAIQSAAGGRYSHAALWTGEGIVESTTPSVEEHSLQASLQKHPRQYVDAYRYRTLSDDDARTVVGRAHEYVGRGYSFGDLFLCASLLAIATTVPRRGQVQFLKDACEFLHFMSVDRPAEGELVTCTQLVVRAFARSGLSIRMRPQAPERVDIQAILGAAGELASASKGAADLSFLSKAERDEWLATQDALRRKCAELSATRGDDDVLRGPLARWDGRSAVNAEGEWRSNLVTPRDLETSPDFERVSRVYPAPAEGEPAPATSE